MAKKKPRTPPPPRHVQAPKHRPHGTKSRSAPADDLGQRGRTILYAVAGSGVVALIIVIAVIVLGGGGSSAGAKNVAKLMTAANCNFKTVKAYVPKGQPIHVSSLTKKFPWNTDPPSNGQHYPEWAVWGFYTEAVNPRQVVHNEEHGGVVLWWGSQVPQSTVNALSAFYQEQPIGGFGTPYPTLGAKIAISAWTGDPNTYGQAGYYGQGHLAVCPAWNAATKKAFTAFRSEYRGKGPEGIPLSADHPGMGPSTQ
ncbi:MAG TPA: DUF3105 domain-containing protein [Gaiellaceae bacterium]